MAFNLLNDLKNQLSGSAVDQLSSFIGGNTSATKSALGSMLPSMLSGIINKADSQNGASQILDIIKGGSLNTDLLSNIGSTIKDTDKSSSLLEMGKGINSSLFGNNLGAIQDNISNASGLEKSATSKLMNIVGPMAMGLLGKKVLADKMGVSGLMGLLSDQKNLIPSGINSFSDGNVKKMSTTREDHEVIENHKSSNGWWKWLLGSLFAIFLLGWLFKNGCGDAEVNGSDNTEEANDITKTSTEETKIIDEHAGHNHASHDGHDHSTHAEHSHGSDDGQSHETTSGSNSATTMSTSTDELSYTMDESGNLIDSKGNIAFAKGTFKELDGHYVDANGKKISLVSKIGKAIGSAATATKDAFVGIFSKMLKKESGAKTTYGLTNIVFDPENHRITSFSKAEVEGLAAALKAYPDSKIQVQQYSNDGNKLSEKRATVIKDMLVTLGVSEKQISAKGMGDDDKVKAAVGKVEIIVK